MTNENVSKLIRVNTAIQRLIDRSFEEASEAYRRGDAGEARQLYEEASALGRILGRIQFDQTGISMWAEL